MRKGGSSADCQRQGMTNVMEAVSRQLSAVSQCCEVRLKPWFFLLLPRSRCALNAASCWLTADG